ncbi:MAG: C40 family peptidase [Candidatus Nitrotoga sp.]
MRLAIILLVNLLFVTFHSAWANNVLKNDASILSKVDESLRAEVLLYAMSLIGTSYKLGGQSSDTGMDCSGFVRHVYSIANGIPLPHNALAISRAGTKIHRAELQLGDLVFFNTMKRTFSHVGIYLGDNRFVHASSSQSASVMISDMGARYWTKRFNGARRILQSVTQDDS